MPLPPSFCQQELAGHPAAGDVVRGDVRADRRAIHGPVERDHLDACGGRLLHHVGDRIRVGGIQQDHRHLLLNQVLDTRDLLGRVVLRIDRDQVDADGLGLRLRAVAQRHEERVVHGRDRQADGGAPGAAAVEPDLPPAALSGP